MTRRLRSGFRDGLTPTAAALLVAGSLMPGVAAARAQTPAPVTERAVDHGSRVEHSLAQLDVQLDDHDATDALARLRTLEKRADLTEEQRAGVERRLLRALGELGRMTEAGARLDAAQQAATTFGSDVDRAWLRLLTGQVAFVSGNPTDALAAWADGRALFQKAGDPRGAHSTHRDQSVHAIVITGTTAS